MVFDSVHLFVLHFHKSKCKSSRRGGITRIVDEGFCILI